MSAADLIAPWGPAPVLPPVHTVDSDDEIEFVGLRHSSPEITILSHRRPPPARASDDDDDDAIVISDAEDDVEDAPPRAGPSNHRRRHHHHHGRPAERELFSPPPPPQHPAIVPPVPPLPPAYWPHRAFPPRRAQPAIYAAPDPMEWEARALVPLAELERGLPAPFPRAAPRSHHVPAMGLGGALLATNRPPADERAAARYRPAPRPAHLYGLDDDGNERPRLIRHVIERPAGFLGSIVDVVRRLTGGARALTDEDALAHYLVGVPPPAAPAPLQPREPDYKPEYTHGLVPAPGFAFDFAPPVVEPGERAAQPIVIDDEPPPRAAEPAPEATLVCAACHDPLLMLGGRATDEAERRRKRVWALRCGHMFDGRCIDAMRQPPPEPKEEPLPQLDIALDLEPEAASPDKKGNGRGKTEPADEVLVDRKGKGKAKAEPEESFDALLLRDGDFPEGPPPSDPPLPSDPAPSDDPAPAAEEAKPALRRKRREWGGIVLDTTVDPTGDPPSMRSRLRRRPGAPPEEPATPPRPTKPMPRKAKGKTKARAPLAERFEWACPVPACGRAHVSVRIEGEWVHDSKLGAIALFV